MHCCDLPMPNIQLSSVYTSSPLAFHLRRKVETHTFAIRNLSTAPKSLSPKIANSTNANASSTTTAITKSTTIATTTTTSTTSPPAIAIKTQISSAAEIAFKATCPPHQQQTTQSTHPSEIKTTTTAHQTQPLLKATSKVKQKVRKKRQITFNSVPVQRHAPFSSKGALLTGAGAAESQQKTERFAKSQHTCGATAVTTVAPARALAGGAERKGVPATQLKSARAQPPAAAIASHPITTSITTAITKTATTIPQAPHQPPPPPLQQQQQTHHIPTIPSFKPAVKRLSSGSIGSIGATISAASGIKATRARLAHFLKIQSPSARKARARRKSSTPSAGSLIVVDIAGAAAGGRGVVFEGCGKASSGAPITTPPASGFGNLPVIVAESGGKAGSAGATAGVGLPVDAGEDGATATATAAATWCGGVNFLVYMVCSFCCCCYNFRNTPTRRMAKDFYKKLFSRKKHSEICHC
ncbi:mucin-19-like [Anastrepha ludens]|uniref:mucin-19-like n=1 Tax=Anastrepha ludens TaxID=28586 RepID=UPI0023AFD427|nr:mucin-19-like [Anastrepha ludens]